MPLFILNESPQVTRPGDLAVFATLNDVALHIELIDVENDECFRFETDGRFYEIRTTEGVDRFDFAPAENRPDVVREVVEEYFRLLGWRWDRTADLADIAAQLGVSSGSARQVP